MAASRAAGLVEVALRCYPARWRRRHGAEAAELAALLIRDGTRASSIAWSYLAGAAREWLTPRPGPRLRTVACALLVVIGSLGVSAGLLASTLPARAAVTSREDQPAQSRPAQSRPAQYQPGPTATVLPAPGRPQVISWTARHVRSG